MHDQILNKELVQLMDKYGVSQAELVERLNVRHAAISHVCTGRRNLGEKLFVKILRKGFRLPEKDVRSIFTKVVTQKYLGD